MVTIETNAIRKQYGKLVAVNDVSLKVESGSIVGLIGPNGAGKTTLLRILATLLKPSRGSGQVLGFDLGADYLQIRKSIGFLPDFFNLYSDLTLRECVHFFARAYGVGRSEADGRVESALEFVQLTEKKDDFIRHLSRGMVQRLGVACLMAHDPQVYLLDEPASGLDPQSRIQLRNVLKGLSGRGKTVIISSHILSDLSDLCSHIAMMNRGRMVLHGDIGEIEKRVLGSRRTRITVLGEPEPAVGLIGEFKAAELIESSGNTLIVRIEGGSAVQADLNAFLVKRGVRVAGIEQESADLEKLFLAISSGKEA